ncbi:MAG TPA: hypothetical protein PL106_09450 [Flavobacteriales bacterium]|nr:hypothetical protein [Flavobacteriales bacterium]
MAQLDTGTRPEQDTAWLDGLRRNDPVLMRSLYKTHFPAIRQFVLQNSGRPSDAQDIFQEAVIVLWMSAKEGRLTMERRTAPADSSSGWRRTNGWTWSGPQRTST